MTVGTVKACLGGVQHVQGLNMICAVSTQDRHCYSTLESLLRCNSKPAAGPCRVPARDASMYAHAAIGATKPCSPVNKGPECCRAEPLSVKAEVPVLVHCRARAAQPALSILSGAELAEVHVTCVPTGL